MFFFVKVYFAQRGDQRGKYLLKADDGSWTVCPAPHEADLATIVSYPNLSFLCTKSAVNFTGCVAEFVRLARSRGTSASPFGCL